MTRRAALLPILLVMAACGGRQESASAPAAQAQGAPAAGTEATEAIAAPQATGSPDGGVGPITSRGTTPEGGAAPAPAPAAPDATGAAAPANDAKLRFDLPKGWTSVPPKSSMRFAQATIPGPAGAGELAAFYFGPGQGGTPDANIERWIDQVEQGAGTPKPERGNLEANGLKITWVDVHGTLKPSTMGMGPSAPIPDARLLGAVVEGPGGPWFFKATGPDKTLGPQKDAFFGMLKSAHAAPNA